MFASVNTFFMCHYLENMGSAGAVKISHVYTKFRNPTEIQELEIPESRISVSATGHRCYESARCRLFLQAPQWTSHAVRKRFSSDQCFQRRSKPNWVGWITHTAAEIPNLL